jgi:hypothetical protein
MMAVYLDLALTIAAIVYIGIALKVYSKKVGFDIHRETQYEIESKIETAISFTEEMAYKAKKELGKQMESAEKLMTAIGRAKELMPHLSEEEIKKLIHGQLRNARRWLGEKVVEVGEDIKD